MNDLLCESELAPMTADMVEELRTQVWQRSSGRVRDFRLLVRGRGLVLQGHAPSYYAKQLVQHAIMEATSLPILANEIEVL
jgi:hypothetical protein